MRILAIEPEGFNGHKNFNTYFLGCLGTIGSVTFVAPSGYLNSCEVDSRIDIPTSLGRHKSKIGARWSQIRVLNYILGVICLDDYDVIVFLAYETVSFSLRWPRNRKVFLFEHNNIENAEGSRIKTFFYKQLPSQAIHLTFQRSTAQFIQDTCGRSATRVPHPHYRGNISISGLFPDGDAWNSLEGRKVIFSPSASTPEPIQDEIRKFVSERQDRYYAICKGEREVNTDSYEVSPFFHNYEEVMGTCDLVFLGVRFEHRVSGVAYEALSYGKPVVIFDSPFARELQKEYPHMVFLINDIRGIEGVDFDQNKIKDDHTRFLIEHAFDTICSDMASALDASKNEVISN